jgi:GT2 family glycosyltransferase
MNLIVLTCRNGRNFTRKCLPTLLDQTVPAPVLILDNASNDGTSTWARAESHKHWDRVIVSTFPFVKSVSELWNFGCRFAWDFGCSEVLIVNNDTELLKYTYYQLYLRMGNDVGLVSCVSRREGESLDYDEISVSPHPDFSCFMIKRSAWEAIGGFDENCRGAFAEDCVAHVELHRKGLRALSISLPFLHHGSATIKEADPVERERIEKHAGENREYFYRKYGKRIATRGYDDLFTPEEFGRNL